MGLVIMITNAFEVGSAKSTDDKLTAFPDLVPIYGLAQ